MAPPPGKRAVLLPTAVFPINTLATVVGSEQWTTEKQVPAPIARTGAWTKGAPKFTAPVGNAWKAAIATSSPPIPGLKKQPAVGGGPIAVKASDVCTSCTFFILKYH